MMERVLSIDLNSATPVYQQIVDELRVRLAGGALTPGTRLPSVRQLAMDLAVHHNTVAEAYRQLAAEGWLELRRGSRAVVAPRRVAAPGDDALDWLDARTRELVVGALGRGLPPQRIIKCLQRWLREVGSDHKGNCEEFDHE